MINRIAPLLALLLIAGCGTTALAPLSPAPARTHATATADPRSAIPTQLRQLVTERHPKAILALAAQDAWQELGRREGSTLRFDVFTDLRLQGSPKTERVEFYGDFDVQTGKLVPGTLLVVSDTEATFRLLVPGR